MGNTVAHTSGISVPRLKKSAETAADFRARVKRATGVAYRAIPVGEKNDLPDGLIVARRGTTYVVTHGYPDRVDPVTGEEIWDPIPENFRRVMLG